MHESAPPYPGPPLHSPGGPPAEVGRPGGVYYAPMTTLRGPPYATQPWGIGPPYATQPWGIGTAYGYPPVVIDGNARVSYTPVGAFVHDVPRQTECPHCHQSVLTETEHMVGLRTWIICLFLCALGCLPCSFIPFCVDTCKETKHRCPSCQKAMYF